jgi:hypothetical protein
MSRKIFSSLGAAAIALCAVGQANAATTWRFDVPPPGTDPCAQSARVTSGVYPFGNNIFCTPVGGGAPTVTATAWSNSAGTATTASGATSIQDAYITVFQNSTGTSPSGIGITNRLVGTTSDPNEAASPEHAIDNNSTNSTTSVLTDIDLGRYDMVRLEFSTAVNLTGLTIGWWHNDVDITVMAFDPTSSSQTASLAGKKYTELTSSGWDLVGHYGNFNPANSSTVLNFATTSSNNIVVAGNTGIESRYWLIGAYNPTVGTNGQSRSALNAGNDYFKLLTVIGQASTPPGPGGNVPEPGSLVLLAAAVLGARRYTKRRAG